MERNPSFLSQKFNKPQELANSREVQAIKERSKANGKEVSNKPDALIQDYLEYLKESLDKENPKREQKLEKFRSVLHDQYVIKPDAIPPSYFAGQKRIARELGYGDREVTEEMKQEMINTVIADQTSSLDRWIHYLASPDALYPDWLKYWAMRSVLGMGKLEKNEDEKGETQAKYTKRSADTTAPFPTLNAAALAETFGALQAKIAWQKKEKETRGEFPNKSTKLSNKEFEALLSGENFSKIYTQFLLEIPEYTTEGLQETRGAWVKYPRHTDPKPLVDSLAGHPLEWCTKDYSTAKTQLTGGDFYVYYSLDSQGKTTIPRAAIRMEEGSIAEVRGIAKDQNTDPYINEVVEQKLTEFPDGELYKKKSSDMKMLSVIEKKHINNLPLTREELVFLYEIDAPIQGFGNGKDTRVKEIVKTRDKMSDACIIFDCLPEQIAKTQKEINENTKAYIGPLFKDIFVQLSHLEHMYISFPERRIRKETFAIGGKTKEQLIQEMKEKNICISDYVTQMMDYPDFFITSEKPHQSDFLRLRVGDMGFGNENPTTDELYKKAEEFGLELCPTETGPAYRLHYTDQPLDECVYIGTKQIVDADGHPCFCVEHNEDGLSLSYDSTDPYDKWNPGYTFLFRLRKLDA